MRKTLSIKGTALPGFAEPTKKPYHEEFDSLENDRLIIDYIDKNRKATQKWLDEDLLMVNLFPYRDCIEHRIISEDPGAVCEWMINARILDIMHHTGKPHIEIKLPQYVSVRPNWIIALNTFIQAVDGGILDTVKTLTMVLSNQDLWAKMDYELAGDRERILMLRWFIWQLLKAK